MDQNTKQIHKGGPPECVIGTMSGPLPEKHRTEYKGHTHTQSRIEIKTSVPDGIRIRVVGLEGKDSTDHATATDHHNYSKLYSSVYGRRRSLTVDVYHQCSAQRQVLHCKLRHQRCNFAKSMSSIANSGT